MRIEKFGLRSGKLLANKYVVLEQIGKGWEGEVYLVREKGTGVLHAAKIFFPHRDKNGKSLRFQARKLHKLRTCDVLIRYHAKEEIIVEGQEVTMLISEFVEGEILSKFVARQPGKRLTPYLAMQVLREIADGVACVHDHKEYHGDIHADNVLIQRTGVWFDVKLVDVYDYGPSKALHIADDVVALVQLFHEILGGQKHYAKQPQYIKDICCGLKHTLIKSKFKNARQLVHHLDTFSWDY